MQKFDGHRNVFQFIPSGNTYASVVVGATAMLVKASVNHSKTIEELSDALNKITEAVAIGETEAALMKSQPMQAAVAKLYIKIFLFFGDAATWYKSSAMSKIGSSLHRNFSERFHNQLEVILQLAANVRYIAQQGSQAEVRVVRLEVKELQDELQDTRIGVEGGLRKTVEFLHAMLVENDRQHQLTRESMAQQHQATQQLLAQYEDRGLLPAPDQAATDFQRMMRPNQQLLLEVPAQCPSNAEWEQRVEFMRTATPEPLSRASTADSLASQLDALTPDSTQPHYSHAGIGNSFERPLANSINAFLASPTSSLLYLEYMSSHLNDSPVQHLTSQLLTSCTAANVACIPSHQSLASNITNLFPDDPAQRFTTLILYMAHEIHKLNPSPSHQSTAHFKDPTPLNAYLPSRAISIFTTTLEVLKSLPSPYSRLLLLIPGHPLINPVDQADITSLIAELKHHINRTNLNLDGNSMKLQILVLTGMRLEGWMPMLKAEEMVLLRQTPAVRMKRVGRGSIFVPED